VGDTPQGCVTPRDLLRRGYLLLANVPDVEAYSLREGKGSGDGFGDGDGYGDGSGGGSDGGYGLGDRRGNGGE